MDINNLGNYANIAAVWQAYPNGGHEGDYLYIPDQSGTKYRWNKYALLWENAATVTDNPARETTTFADINVQNDVHVGGSAYIQDNLKVQGRLYAKVKQPNVGLFATLEALQAAYPTPEVGMWAVVGDTVPGYIYRCDTAGEWSATGETGGVDELENVLLYSEQQLTAAEKKQARANLGMGNGDFATGSDFDVPDSTKRAKVVTVGAVLDGADAMPTAGSENLVKSGGVHEAVNECIEELQGIGENIVEQNRENIESALNEFAPVQITGDVTNAADEEDITSIEVGGTNVLKFKNRTYNPLTYNGKGKVILRKNIKEINGVTNNWLEQSMMTQVNTIYIIQYNYAISTEDSNTINIPEGSVLMFEGGSISNGVISGQDTTIVADNVMIFGDNTRISGSFSNKYYYSTWFADKNFIPAVMGVNPNSVAVLCENITMDFATHSDMTHLSIEGNGFTITDSGVFVLSGDCDVENVVFAYSSSKRDEFASPRSIIYYPNIAKNRKDINIRLKNISADGNNYMQGLIAYKTTKPSSITYSNLDDLHVEITDCVITNMTNYGLNLISKITGTISNNVIKHIGWEKLEGDDDLYGGWGLRVGYNFGVDYLSEEYHAHDMIIENNVIENIVATYSETNDGHNHYFILCYGSNIAVRNNHLTNLSTSFERYIDPGMDSEGIYIKGRDCNVTNNYIYNGAGSLSDAVINLKVGSSSNNVIDSNYIVYNGSKLGVAVRVGGGNIQVINNVIDTENASDSNSGSARYCFYVGDSGVIKFANNKVSGSVLFKRGFFL